MRPIRNSSGARLMLLAFLAIVLAGSVIDTRQTRVASTTATTAERDIDLFSAVVARIRAGERYYDAMGTELRQRRYPTASVFNWRTPLLYSAIAAIGPGSVHAVLVCLALALLVLTVVVLGKRHAAPLMVGLFVQVGAVVAVMVSSATLLTEAWAGVLLALSVCAYQMRAWRTAAGLGLLALFVRELAAPYVVLCAFLALRNKRWDEVTIWSAGALAYSIYFGWHVHEVRALQGPGDLAQAYSWLYGGGPAFLLRTLRTNAWLLVSPPWIPSASGLLAILLAACAWTHTAPHLRATVLVYVVMFIIVGQPFNYYWGLLTAPTWALVTADGVDALRHWLAIARQPRLGPDISLS